MTQCGKRIKHDGREAVNTLLSNLVLTEYTIQFIHPLSHSIQEPVQTVNRTLYMDTKSWQLHTAEFDVQQLKNTASSWRIVQLVSSVLSI